VSGEKTVARLRDASAARTEKAAHTSAVRITEQARQLAALEQALQSVPVVDEARVSAIRQAIENGSYEVAPERIADKLVSLERELAALEK
jgi:negative regulator of flagellin synthesis FlgM